jgi:polysaccharide pyruvyl transferase WcaK-like protein
MMRLLAPFGFYGWGNIGDEATLNGFARLLAASEVHAQVTLGSRDPAHTARVEPAFRYFDAARLDPRRWYAALRANAHAVVGGTPIMDVLGDWPLCELTPLVRSVDRWKVPFVFLGVGIEDLHRDASRRLVAGEIVPRVAGWSVRSDRDRQRLEALGVAPRTITVAADMAWLIDPASSAFGRGWLQRCGVPLDRPIVGVNLVNENACFDRQPAMATELAAALDELCRRLDARIVFLANEVRPGDGFDQAAAARVRGRMRSVDRVVTAPAEYLAPRQMMSIVGCCALTLSMRYHFCMFSALQRVPFIAIERCTKIADLSRDLRWSASVQPQAMEAANVAWHGSQLYEDNAAVRQRLDRIAQDMKRRAMSSIAPLAELGARPVSLSPSTLQGKP